MNLLLTAFLPRDDIEMEEEIDSIMPGPGQLEVFVVDTFSVGFKKPQRVVESFISRGKIGTRDAT